MPPSLRVAFPLLLASACAMRKSALPFNLPDKAACQRQPKQPKNPKQVLDFPDKEGKRSQARLVFAPPCLLRLASRSPWQPCFPLAKWTKQLKTEERFHKKKAKLQSGPTRHQRPQPRLQQRRRPPALQGRPQPPKHATRAASTLARADTTHRGEPSQRDQVRPLSGGHGLAAPSAPGWGRRVSPGSPAAAAHGPVGGRSPSAPARGLRAPGRPRGGRRGRRGPGDGGQDRGRAQEPRNLRPDPQRVPGGGGHKGE